MNSGRFVYLDNAATSFPKPRRALECALEEYARVGVSPGRGSYDLSAEAESLVTDVRRRLADFFDAPDPDRVIFAANATDALNLAIPGMVRPGSHVVSTRLEHNSVLRPLHHLRERGLLEYDLVPFNHGGLVDPADVAAALRPNTSLVVVSHASQVLGTVQPIVEIGRLCARRGIPLLVDAAQSAGQIPVRLSAGNISAIAFTGHKALLGPSGIGGLVIAPDVNVASSRYGGTGLQSGSLIHTQSYPHRLEAGTINLLGIIGLREGMKDLLREGVEQAHTRQMRLVRRLHDELAALPRTIVYSPYPRDGDVPILTCNIEGISSSDTGAILDTDYGIAVRTGLHCAPLVHVELGTLETGAVRFSLGHLTSDEDIDCAVEAMAAIAGG